MCQTYSLTGKNQFFVNCIYFLMIGAMNNSSRIFNKIDSYSRGLILFVEK